MERDVLGSALVAIVVCCEVVKVLKKNRERRKLIT